MSQLHESVWRLLQEAHDLYWDDRDATQQLQHLLSRFEEPLRIAVAGPSKAGKTTLVNAIMGEEVTLGAGIAQGFIWYQDGPEPAVTAYSPDGSARELAVIRSAGGMRVDLGGWRPDKVNDVLVEWPMRALRHVTLVDTPSLTAADDPFLRDMDAVLYLTPDRRDTDLRVLQAAQDGVVARSAPVNVLLVLSRADEIGGGRIDALLTARQLARRHHRDPQVNAVCLGVIALGGLVALASRVLTEPDFAALTTLAGAQPSEVERFVLSADRFIGPDFPAPLHAQTRRALVERFGIHGIRLAMTLIRAGHDTRARLATELARRSGLTELRESINQYFIERREVLKARSALTGLELVLRAQPRQGTPELLAGIEQIMAGAHDFRELRLLAALRANGIGFDADLVAEAHRLIGGNGTDPAARLGIDHEVAEAEVWELSREALYRWQLQAEDQRLDLAQRRAAAVVVRSCEGILAELSRERY